MKYADLKHEMRLGDLKYDPWGTCMQWFFTVAEVACFERDIDDSAWGFSPGMGSEPEDTWELGIVRDLNDADLERFGNFLNKYSSMLKHAGKDY